MGETKTAQTAGGQAAKPAEPSYDREAKLKELLKEDDKGNAFADPFMGF